MLSAQELWDEYHASNKYTITFDYDGTSNLDIDLYMRDGKKVNTMNKEETKQEALDKIEELKKLIEQIDNEQPDIPGWEESLSDGFYVANDNITMYPIKGKVWPSDKNLFATKKQAEAMLAFAQLTQIHREIVKRNCPKWAPCRDVSFINKNFNIVMVSNELRVYNLSDWISPLALPTEELAQAFLDKHRDLWTTFWEGMS